ncbi:MAG: quinolinate synthase NadA [Candidatus Brocadiia bacterium]
MMSTGTIEDRIEELKERRNAVLLVHNYQRPELQEMADYLGDSLGLSREAAHSDAEVIVFCGVHFMAETASILCPDKTVLIPDPKSGCPMADMVTAEELRELKREHPDAVVVCYVNSTAEVKAESDLCCTSANATQIVESIDPDRPVIFVPDKYLGRWTALKTGRDLILWEGYCSTHASITPTDVERAREKHPDAEVVVHPECLTEVSRMADAVESTSGMCRFAARTQAEEIIVGTEIGLIERLRRENPDKTFYPVTSAAVCPNMKLHTPEKVLWSLEEMETRVSVSDDIAQRARGAIDAMVEIGRETE